MINPDWKDYMGKDAYLRPSEGQLRFVWGEVDDHGTPRRVRKLQRFEWSHTLGEHGWFDVVMYEEDDGQT